MFVVDGIIEGGELADEVAIKLANGIVVILPKEENLRHKSLPTRTGTVIASVATGTSGHYPKKCQ